MMWDAMSSLKRRLRVWFGPSTGRATAGGSKPAAPTDPIAQVAPLVRPDARWTPYDFRRFLEALPDDALLGLMINLGILKEDATVADLDRKYTRSYLVIKNMMKRSMNLLKYPFSGDVYGYDYHTTVAWVAERQGVPRRDCESLSTFMLEREVQKRVFAAMWDKLTEAQRLELLEKLEDTLGNGGLSKEDKLALVGLSGAGAMATLSATVFFSGFAFYTTMSVTISTVAGLFGLTLPFAAYTGASTTVALLAGPVGWAIAGVVALGSLALMGRADLKKTTPAVLQIHGLKVAALLAAGVPEDRIFSS